MQDVPLATPAPPFPRLGRIALGVAGAALAALVAVQAWQVLARYLLNASPGWTEPVTLVLLSSAMCLGAAVGVQQGSHFAFGLLRDALPARVARALRVFSHAIAIGIGSLLAVQGTRLALDAIDVPMAGVPLPQGLGFLPLALGGGLIALFAAAHLLRELRGSS